MNGKSKFKTMGVEGGDANIHRLLFADDTVEVILVEHEDDASYTFSEG